MIRPIAISLSPNTEADDVWLAAKTLLSPEDWEDREQTRLLEKEFASFFGKGYSAFALNSGRSAEYVILKALGVGKGDEVLVQAFTCVAVPNSISWLEAKPVYVDTDSSFNLDPKDLERKISKKTRAILVQHTFGVPAQIEKIKKIAKKAGIPLIEDCAHGLGATFKSKPLGTFGDASFFSFGRDKALSCVFGGTILARDEFAKKIKREVDALGNPPKGWIAQQLFHPVAFSLILPLYNLTVGKVILVLLQKAGLLSKAVYRKEKSGGRPRIFPSRMPGGLAILARNQLKKLDEFIKRRRRIARFYSKELKGNGLVLPERSPGASWLRFSIMHPQAGQLFRFAKQRGVLLGDWYRGIVVPAKRLQAVEYKMGSCPNAEKQAREVVNLPTYPTMNKKEAAKVVKLVKQWLVTK